MDNLATRSFSDEQAEKTGQSARGVRRDAERGEKVCDDALRLLIGNPYARAGIGPFLKSEETPQGYGSLKVGLIC